MQTIIKMLKKIILFVLIALGTISGIMKMLLIPEEVEFFTRAGLNETLIFLIGFSQLTGSILIFFKKPRKAGAFILAVTFGISTFLIFISGKIIFGFISFLPILMTFFIIKEKV